MVLGRETKALALPHRHRGCYSGGYGHVFPGLSKGSGVSSKPSGVHGRSIREQPIPYLCRLYDPTEGTITLDHIDLRQFDPIALRSEISVIFQDYVKYQLTARENISLGNIDVTPGEEDVIKAAQCAGAHDIISRLPKGYETILGKWFEAGEELSIGEWQKIALARAFLRNSQIIVLDEPTSSLDAKTEYEIFSRLPELLENRSTILISHRFSTVRMADRIFVFEGGRILEQGSHEDLMRTGGKYASLFKKQAQYYLK